MLYNFYMNWLNTSSSCKAVEFYKIFPMCLFCVCHVLHALENLGMCSGVCMRSYTSYYKDSHVNGWNGSKWERLGNDAAMHNLST